MWDSDCQWDALDYIEGQCIGHDEEWTGDGDYEDSAGICRGDRKEI